ncbi:MAG: hypothetical protein ACYCXN_03865 [Acidimicrobiales bacterium]
MSVGALQGAGSARQALADLRRARRRRRMSEVDVMEALYHAYVAAIVGGLALWWIALRVGGHEVARASVHSALVHGPEMVGLAIAAALAIGLRSGGRGGPLVVEAPDVRLVLLSPLDRGVALRGPALRLLRFGAAWGAGAGAVVGVLASRRLGGHWPVWGVSGALVGALVVDAALGAAMVVSGLRLRRQMAGALALVALAWSGVDLALARATSPMSLLGQAAFWPLRWSPSGLGGVAFAVLAVVLGVVLAGGTSVEASERRASLAGQLRFAVTLRDLRSVILLRRQLAQESPRERPWLGAHRSPRHRSGRRFVLWRRGWQGLLRFPLTRLVRLVLLGAAAGAAGVGTWRGTTPLVLAAGLALYVAGLDVIEPVAESVDRPTLLDAYPLERGSVLVGLLAAPAAAMLAVGIVGAATAVAIAGGGTKALAVAAVLVIPASMAGLAGATVSTVQGPPALFSDSDLLLPPEAVGAKVAIRTLWPPLVATAGMLPLLAARSTPALPASSAVSATIPVLLLVGGVAIWARHREAIHRAFKEAMGGAGTKA